MPSPKKKLPPMTAVLPSDHPDVLAATQAVLERMPACALPNCNACARNRTAVQALITTVVANVLITPAEPAT